MPAGMSTTTGSGANAPFMRTNASPDPTVDPKPSTSSGSSDSRPTRRPFAARRLVDVDRHRPARCGSGPSHCARGSRRRSASSPAGGAATAGAVGRVVAGEVELVDAAVAPLLGLGRRERRRPRPAPHSTRRCSASASGPPRRSASARDVNGVLAHAGTGHATERADASRRTDARRRSAASSAGRSASGLPIRGRGQDLGRRERGVAGELLASHRLGQDVHPVSTNGRTCRCAPWSRQRWSSGSPTSSNGLARDLDRAPRCPGVCAVRSGR